MAEQQKATGVRALRATAHTVAWPKDEAESREMAQYAIVLVSTISRAEKELPLKRVYHVSPEGIETTLQKLSSWRSSVNPANLAYSELGSFRKDGFYLAPVAALKRNGQIQMDFNVARFNYRLTQLPSGEALGYELRDPAPGAKPAPAKLRAFIAPREFPGLPVPRPMQ